MIGRPIRKPEWRKFPHLPAPQAGVDEVGRGALAGDVVAAAVILVPETEIQGLNDSKKLAAPRREACYREILDTCASFAIGRASPAEIDELDVLRASLLAMQRAVARLAVQPASILVDGNILPEWPYPTEAIPGGDGSVPGIAAASIIAKVTRDREMTALQDQYPAYDFPRHKGYPTPRHLQILARQGPTPIHRHSFAPVRRAMVK